MRCSGGTATTTKRFFALTCRCAGNCFCERGGILISNLEALVNPRLFFLVLSLLLLPAIANAATEPITDFQPLTVHYRETRSNQGAGKAVADWYFARRAGEVEAARGDSAEVWKRDIRGDITLIRVFHQDQKLIQYTSGELRTQSRYPDWVSLNSIFDPRKISALKRVGTVSYLGRPASCYQGKLDSQKVKVVWLDSEALTAKVVRSWRGNSVTLELKELRTVPDANWPQAGLGKAEAYALLDGADLGDMEYDPFVQRVLGRDGDHGGHAHYH
jgi:hypothetical protein